MALLRLRNDAVAWREVDGEVLVLGLDSSTYFSVNSTGGLLWKRLAAGTTRDDLVASLVTEFDVDRDRAAADVDAFLSHLGSSGLLET
jgi:coenzyme PQQ synthesis protein D (PqqD)